MSNGAIRIFKTRANKAFHPFARLPNPGSTKVALGQRVLILLAEKRLALRMLDLVGVLAGGGGEGGTIRKFFSTASGTLCKHFPGTFKLGRNLLKNRLACKLLSQARKASRPLEWSALGTVMKLSLAPILLTASYALMGCATLPEPRTQATGEPLSVRSKTETYTYQTQEKVGEVQHRSASGHALGTSTVYANRTHVGSYQVWSGYQGSTPVTDDDFYRIAKDKAAQDEVESSREAGVLLNRLGLGVLALGAVALGGGVVLRGDTSSNLPSSLLYGGSILLPVGGVLAYLGLGKATNPHPLEQDRAQAAAQAYNASLETPASQTNTTSAKLPR